MEVARAIRRDSDLPIVMLTVRVQEDDRLRGLDQRRQLHHRDLQCFAAWRAGGRAQGAGCVAVRSVVVQVRRESRRSENVSALSFDFTRVVSLARDERSDDGAGVVSLNDEIKRVWKTARQGSANVSVHLLIQQRLISNPTDDAFELLKKLIAETGRLSFVPIARSSDVVSCPRANAKTKRHRFGNSSSRTSCHA